VADLGHVRELCDRHGIHTVECMFADTWGIPRGKRLPVRQFLKSAEFAMANVCFSWDMQCFIHPTPFVDDTHGYPDLHAKADLSTFRVAGWQEGLAVCVCDTFDIDTHEPVAMDGRNILRRAIARLGAQGYEPMAATELEFHLCRTDWEPVYRGVHCYSIPKIGDVEPVASEICQALEKTGIDVEAYNVEYGPAQVEMNLAYGPALAVADNTMLFKHVVKQVAVRHGLRATFMAKPFAGEAGNGMHVHQSLRGRDGKNAFAAHDAEPPVQSVLMRRALAGLVAHQRDLQAIMNPTINSYKRVSDYSFAPTQVSWGLDHRLVGVRCVVEHGEATRLEARWASADANPYLVLAGCLGAAAEGLEREIELPPMVSGDPHVDAALERLPTTLEGATANFASSAAARKIYGDMLVDTFVVMLRNELAQFAGSITDWERARYQEVM
jgi:glutamine synthetase